MKNSLFRSIGLSLILIVTLSLVISCGGGRTEPEEPLPTPTRIKEMSTESSESTGGAAQPVSPLAESRTESPLQTPDEATSADEDIVAEAVPESILINEAIAAVSIGEYNVARSQLDQAIINGEELTRAYITRGSLSFEQLRFMEAEQDFTASLAIETTLEALARRCQTYMMLDRYDEGIQDCQQAMVLDPNSPVPHAKIAQIYLERNHKIEEAVEVDQTEAEVEAGADTSDEAEEGDGEVASEEAEGESEAEQPEKAVEKSDKELARESIDKALALVPDEIEPAMAADISDIFYIAGLIGLNEGGGGPEIDPETMTEQEIEAAKAERSKANDLRIETVLDNLSKCIEIQYEPRCLWERGFIYFGFADIENSIADMEAIIEGGNPMRHGTFIFRAGTQLQVMRGSSD